MKRSQVFPSKYLKAADLKGKSVVVTIERTTFDKLKAPDGKEQEKAVLSFHNVKKTLPLNCTNYDAVAAIVGDDETDTWPGHQIELFPTKTSMGGRVVDCVRVRPPAQPNLLNQKAKQQKSSAAPVNVLEEPVEEEDIDDEVPSL